LSDCLRKKPGRFSVEAIADNGEAYQYAEDWREVFLSAGWEDKHKNIPIQVFTIGGGTYSGVRISVHDASTVQGQIALADGSPEQGVEKCLMGRSDLPGGGSIMSFKDSPSGSVDIEVSYQPQPR